MGRGEGPGEGSGEGATVSGSRCPKCGAGLVRTTKPMGLVYFSCTACSWHDR